MDYFKIGQRIRKFRKAHGLSQEDIAERIGISVTHMSHIETGNTKLSLPVLVDIANLLEVRTDDLLTDAELQNASTVTDDILKVLNRCNTQELKIILSIVKATKVSLDQNL